MNRSRSVRAVATTCSLAVVLAGCAVDRFDVAYDDVFAARAEDAVDRGWVPDWLPEGSTDIHAALDPVDGESLLAATLPDDTTTIDEACDEELPEDTTLPALTASWFDRELAESATPRACDDDRLVVVAGDRVVAWTPPGVPPLDPEK